MSTVNNNPEENKIITETSSSSTSSTALEGWNFDSKPKSPVSTGVVKAGVMSKDSKFDEYKKVAEEKKKRDEILKRPETKNPSPSGKKKFSISKIRKILDVLRPLFSVQRAKMIKIQLSEIFWETSSKLTREAIRQVQQPDLHSPFWVFLMMNLKVCSL